VSRVTLVTYFHPLTAALAIVLLAYVGWLGLRARNDRRHARQLLACHARWAPFMYWGVMISWALGVTTTWRLRPDLELADSAHFQVGAALAVVLTGSWLSGRWMHWPQVRSLHPWLGVAAMLLAAAQVFFGLQITP